MQTRSAGAAHCPPSWSTPRTKRPSYGPAVGAIAKSLGKPLMPWQQHVADVALEYDPVTKKLAYREVRLTVPRQSGKSTLILPTVVFRAEAAELLGGRQNMLYAAQTGVDSRSKWRNDYIPDLEACRAMRGLFRVSLANGHEAVIFRNQSRFSPSATTLKSGHGQVLDCGFLDEAFAQVDDRVDQAWGPAMVTRPWAQKWIVSTVGHAGSLYLKQKNDEGRIQAESGRTDGICYFEWSADPEADPADPATWWSCMPALGFTVTEEIVQHNFNTMALNEFRRSFLNQWTDLLLDPVVPMASWSSCRDPQSRRTGKRVVLALDVAFDRSSAAVAMAGPRSDGLAHVQVVRHGPGTDWVVDEIVKMVREKKVRTVVIDSGGPAASFITDLKNKRVDVKVMAAEDMKRACGSFYDAVVTEQVRHLGQPELDSALSGAGQRNLLDAWAWSRRNSACDISPLVAATSALWGLSELGPERDVLKTFL